MDIVLKAINDKKITKKKVKAILGISFPTLQRKIEEREFSDEDIYSIKTFLFTHSLGGDDLIGMFKEKFRRCTFILLDEESTGENKKWNRKIKLINERFLYIVDIRVFFRTQTIKSKNKKTIDTISGSISSILFQDILIKDLHSDTEIVVDFAIVEKMYKIVKEYLPLKSYYK